MYKIILTIVIFLAIPTTSHAMKFDGTDDGVTIGNLSALHASSSDLTLSVWIKPNDFTVATKGIFGMSGIGAGVVPYMIEFNRSAARFSFTQVGTGAGTPTLTNTTNLTLGQWQHIVVTRKYNTVTDWTVALYLNGRPNGGGTIARSGGTSQVLAIGRYGGHTLYFNGEIADARMYNKVMTPQEVRALYYGFDTYQGLMARWILDGNSLPFVPGGTGKYNASATGGATKATLPERLKLFNK